MAWLALASCSTSSAWAIVFVGGNPASSTRSHVAQTLRDARAAQHGRGCHHADHRWFLTKPWAGRRSLAFRRAGPSVDCAGTSGHRGGDGGLDAERQRREGGLANDDTFRWVYAWKIGDRSVVETSEEELADYYFRFEGRTHHAGEYQEYLEYMARCIETGTPKPDAVGGGTVAPMEAMEQAVARAPGPVREVSSGTLEPIT
jgi:hypothetical protein